MAEEYGAAARGVTAPDGSPDVQAMVHNVVSEHRVLRNDNGVTVLAMEEVLAVTKRRDVHSMSPAVVELAGQFMGAGRPLIPLMLDGEDHTKYRRLLDPLFAPKIVNQLEPRVRALSNELIDGFIADGRVELFSAFCEPLPCKIFLSQLGLPLEELNFLLWFKDGIIRPTDDEHRSSANTRMIEFLYAELDRREAETEPRDDLIAGFMTAEVDGHRLTREDVIDITFLLVLAGLDTVSASLSCIVDWFARNPDQRRIVLDDPGMLPGAIEELMRFHTPVVGGGRFATEDFEIGGEQVRAGENISVNWAAANLDASAFDDPLTVDLGRTVNRHIAFASGFHRCLGSHLARMELRAAIDTLHQRIPDYALDPDAQPGYHNAGIRNVDPLPLVFTASA
ncbi:MAG TPA: cytochrome P450 [Acidimicrobiales bacterium]|nr:cytochrome P450 [Acidimicrobiales bacterium]